KLNLFAVACARRVVPLLTDPRFLQALDCVEEFLEGRAPWTILNARTQTAKEARERHLDCPEKWAAWAGVLAGRAAEDASFSSGESWSVWIPEAITLAAQATGTDSRDTFHPWLEGVVQAGLLRCIVGNPFQSVSVDPSWLSWEGGTVGTMA